MKPWLSAIIKIFIVILVIAAFIIVITINESAADRVALAPSPEPTTTVLTTTATPQPTPTPTPEVTPEPAYIPEPDELQPFELAELPISGSRIEYSVQYGSLLANWEISSKADYSVLYALDANDVVYYKDILWADIDNWSISGIRHGSLLLLFYKDMGEKSAEDDELIKAIYQPIVADDSMFAANETLQNKYYIIVDKEDYTFAIFTYDENGEYTKLVKAFPCAVGRSARMTALGSFEISSKGAWKRWNSGQFSPYYTKYTAGVYIHGPIFSRKSFDTLQQRSYNAIGSSATSGCIRTTVEAAMWVYYECPAGTVIEVVESSDKVEHVEKIPIDENYPRWDPTDINKPVADTEEN